MWGVFRLWRGPGSLPWAKGQRPKVLCPGSLPRAKHIFNQTSRMEWQLPIQKVEISNINIGSPWARELKKEYAQKPMAPLSYFSTHFRMPFVSLLFPPLPVLEYNPTSGRLVLDMTETSLASIKLSTFQDTLVNAIVYHQYAWFKSDF